MDGKDLLQSDLSRENLIIPDIDIKNERIRRRKAEWYEKNKERLAKKWSSDPKRKETQRIYYKKNKISYDKSIYLLIKIGYKTINCKEFLRGNYEKK